MHLDDLDDLGDPDALFIHLDGDQGGLEVRAGTEHYGPDAARAPIELDVDALPGRLAEHDRLLYALFDPSTGDPSEVHRQLVALQESLGSELFGVLSRGKLGRLYQRLLGAIEDDRSAGLRLCITSDPSNRHLHRLASAPWELLFDGESRDFIGCRRRFPISRYFTGLQRIQPLALDSPLKLLFVVSEPEGESPLLDEPEKEAIRLALRKLPGVEFFEQQPVVHRIRDTIRAEGIHALHFIGHGGMAEGQGWLTFADERNQPVAWTGDELADYLKDLPSLRLVVLSACHGASVARRTEQDAFWSMAPSLLMRAGVPALVAMQGPVTDGAAIAFSERFYRGLADFDPIDVAASEARLAMRDKAQAKNTRVQWPLPAVFTRVDDGVLIKPGTAVGVRSSRPAKEVRTIGIRSFATGFGEGLEERVQDFLGLEDLFEGRWVRSRELWNGEILDRLRDFLSAFVVDRRTLEIDFAAPWSIAFATGWYLEAKSGLDIAIRQRGQGGTMVLYDQEGACPEGPLWTFEDLRFDTGTDLAVAISLTHHTLTDVRAFLGEKSGPGVGRVLHAEPVGGFRTDSVQSGRHALRLAQELDRELQKRSLSERRGTLHLFDAAPNTFTFFLGQLAGTFGRVQLYEYPFRERDSFGDYRPSIIFPPWKEDAAAATAR